MANILSEIVDRKREVVARLRADWAARDFRDRALAIRANATPHPLLRSLESNSGRVNIIAEYKRRSPSAGTAVKTFTISPEDFGLQRRSITQCREGPMENAQVIRAILHGEKNGDFAVARDLVVINAAAALYLADVANDFQNATAMARESIDSGQAASKLEALIRETNRSW